MRHALLVALAAAGCAPTMGPFNWAPREADVQRLAEKHPHAVAVILSRDDRVTLNFRPGFASTMMRHDVIAILAEGGSHWAEVAIPVGNARVQFLRARTIGADGHAEEVTPEEVHSAVARTGGRLDGVESTVQVFRVPGARVGSVVEYSYGLLNDRPSYYLRGPMSATVPIEHYHLEVEIAGEVDAGIRIYNANAKVEKHGGFETQQFVLDQRDIPASAPEKFAPPPSVTEPWWTVAVTRAVLRHRLLGIYDTWSHTLSGLSKILFEDKAKDYAGAALKPSLDGCDGNAHCAAERALVLINAKTELTRFVSDLLDVRPLKDVLASGTANSVEKALLLRAALETAGVKASLALLARNLDVDFDPDFPSPGRVDHMIVFVERQPGVDASFFIDPSCESCALGQIPEWSKDRQALVFGKADVRTANTQLETPVQITRVDGADPAMSVHKQLIEADLDMEGGLRGRITDEWHGVQAVDFRIESRDWSAERWQRLLADDLHERAKTVQPRAVTPLSWDRRDARASVSVEFTAPGYAADDAGRLIVPLSILHMAADRELPDEPRRHDVMVRAATREEETMVLRLPGGWAASELPTPQVWHSDAADGLLEVTSSPGKVTIRRVWQTHVGHWGPGEFDDLGSVMRKLAAVRAAAFAVSHAH